MPSLLLAAIFFAGIHLGIAGTTVRDRATAVLGESAYMVAFSLASVVGLAWIVAAYKLAVDGAHGVRQPRPLRSSI